MEEKTEIMGRPSNRRGDTRVAAPNSRPVFMFGNGSRFNVPKEILESDHDNDYGYVVYSSGNVDQTQNYNSAYDRGWMPVYASEHPSLSRDSIPTPFASKQENQLITKGGQVLMKRDKEISRQENVYHDESKRSMEQKTEAHKHYDPRMPRPHKQFSEHMLTH